MQDLTELQHWVVRHLQQLRALPKDAAIRAEAADRLTGNDRLAPVEQLEIYREQFWLRHTASLVEDFPGVGGVLGQADWEQLVEGYLQAHPSESWTLRELGRHFAEHVTHCPALA
ncbi:MAG TPA: DNA-binding domain-containing protein, partial [Polyangiaceae bacterium]|nr:DNA-binding domain-containing protein [Polyangiaceae bacterium]